MKKIIKKLEKKLKLKVEKLSKNLKNLSLKVM